MGHIGGKLPAAAFSSNLLRHVKGQQHRPHHSTIHRNLADVKLVLPVIPYGTDFTVSPFQCGLNGAVDLMVTICHKEILPHAGITRMKDLPCGGVDA